MSGHFEQGEKPRIGWCFLFCFNEFAISGKECPLNIKTKEPNLLIPGICLILASVTFWLYQPVMNHDFVNYDDLGYVKENPNVQQGVSFRSVSWAFATGHAGNWHPVTWISHMLDCQVFGALNPGGHHLTNVLFHIANGILLFLLLWRMTSATWRSALVAALFAWHPMHVESVAWIAERKDVLSTFFGLLALLAYANYAMQPDRFSKKTRNILIVSGALFALGLMSKPMVVTLPFVMLLMDYWPLKRTSPGASQSSPNFAGGTQEQTTAGLTFWDLIREKRVFFAMTALVSIITFLVQKSGHAVVSMAKVPLPLRLENSTVSYLGYIQKMLWPSPLSVIYPLHGDISAGRVMMALALILTATTLAMKFYRSAPYLAIGWFWFLGMLVPVIGIVQVGEQSMADRYSYLPLVGLFIAVVWGLFDWIGENDIFKRILLGLIFVPALIACIIGTARQIPVWQNGETLFRHAIEVTPNNVSACVNLASALDAADRPEEAEAVLKEAEKFNVKSDSLLSGLGTHYDKVGNTNVAEKYLLELVADMPDAPGVHYNLGNVYSHEGRFKEAEEQFKMEIKIDPDALDAHQNLGVLLLNDRLYDEALAQFTEALRVSPDSPEAHERMGETLVRMGKSDRAQFHFQEAVLLKPEFIHARIQLGLILARQGDLMAAIPHFQEALKLDLHNADGWYNLAAAFEGLKRYDEASQAFATALKLRPEDADTHVRLAAVMTKLGKYKEAVAEYREALKQKPDFLAALAQLSWLLSSRPSAEFHNSAEAVELALKADELTRHQAPNVLVVLDVAYAAAGRFDDAIKTAEKLVKMATDNNLREIATKATARIELYKAGKPFQEE